MKYLLLIMLPVVLFGSMSQESEEAEGKRKICRGKVSAMLLQSSSDASPHERFSKLMQVSQEIEDFFRTEFDIHDDYSIHLRVVSWFKSGGDCSYHCKLFKSLRTNSNLRSDEDIVNFSVEFTYFHEIIKQWDKIYAAFKSEMRADLWRMHTINMRFVFAAMFPHFANRVCYT
ncbi:MAG: hypothetical protein OXC30_00165 [Alphaproteobacteria bacterium]|nr:hypothetical protein [Alphaproteobacteria bacterium]